jgi:hypothetical protein
MGQTLGTTRESSQIAGMSDVVAAVFVNGPELAQRTPRIIAEMENFTRSALTERFIRRRKHEDNVENLITIGGDNVFVEFPSGAGVR